MYAFEHKASIVITSRALMFFLSNMFVEITLAIARFPVCPFPSPHNIRRFGPSRSSLPTLGICESKNFTVNVL